MRFSNWQLNRLRDALRAYHQYESGADSGRFTWVDVREAIAVYTSVEIGGTGKTGPKKGAERLRQFVEGIKHPQYPGVKRFPVPQDESLAAIYNFVTNDTLKLLSKEELDEYEPNRQAPLRLLEYLDYSPDAERMIPMGKLEGTYVHFATHEDRHIHRVFEFSPPSDEGLVQVSEVEKYYDPDKVNIPDHNNRFLIMSKGAEDLSHVEYKGWGVLTPEDNLFLFLKNPRNGRNRYYFTLGTDLVHWDDNPVKQLALLQHDFPVEMRDAEIDQDWKTVVLAETAHKILFSKRPGR